MPNKVLLLIEDDYDVAEMLLMYFKSYDYEVYHADNGQEGIEFARTKFPNLILLDVMLPDMDGYDICVALRQKAMTRYIPLLFLTQKDERASKVRGLELGADDYITKPFDIDELRLRVQGGINRATRENLNEPRTGLPTGSLIDDEIKRRLRAKDQFTHITYTLEGFRQFHDLYGFVVANDVINYAGSLIQKVVSEYGTPDDFVGIDKDTLILLTHTEHPKILDKTIRERFDEEVRIFYPFTDSDQGGMFIDEGLDTQEFVPLIYLSSQFRQTVSS